MGQPILLLRLEGPLQSWGTRSRWDVRDTAPEPTKSGVLGLIGCALGLRRGDERFLQLDAGLRFGVRTECPGHKIIDFQTITDFLPTAAGEFKGQGTRKKVLADLQSDPEAVPATIISPRAYLEDAAFLAALEARPGASDLIHECALALRKPNWPLFLGRKACVPTRPIFEALTEEYADLEDALARHAWSWLGRNGQQRTRPRETQLEAWIEDGARDGTVRTATRQDVIRLNSARLYGFRQASLRICEPPTRQEAHS